MEGWVTGKLQRAAQIRQHNNKDNLSFTLRCDRDVNGKTYSDYVGVTVYGNEIQKFASLPVGSLVSASGGRYGTRVYEKDGQQKAALTYSCFASGIRVLLRAEGEAKMAPTGTGAPPAMSPATTGRAEASTDDVPF